MANLPSGSHILSGAESQRLRSFCSSESFSASDLDQYAHLLQKGTLEAVRADFQVRAEADGLEQARNSLAAMAYGPTKITLYNYTLQLIFLDPRNRARYLNYFRFLALEAKVPVDSRDLSGTTTFMHSISTKPYLETEVADILLEAGAEINHRNRYGCVATHDIVMIMDFTPVGKKRLLTH
ncbi:hypothetical protein BKA61DRAFT_141083 [Leptodontidium sp. MPI-SDFR-AT-0119]|nr:hypothetical protein BKA61DRAFT_141083 [Leptodontidium sp. MPI-SDFR-AT-0119]